MDHSNIANQSFMKLARQTLRVYALHLRAYPLQMTLAIGLLPFGVIFLSVLNPLIAASLIDRIASGTFDPERTTILEEFGPFVLLYFISGLAGNTVWRINGFLFSDYFTKVMRNLEAFVFDYLTQHSYRFFADSFSGALVAQHKRFISSFERITDMVYWDLYRTTVLVVISIGVITYYTPVLGIAMFVWAAFFTSLSLWLNIKKSKYSRIFAASDSSVTARIADVITNILTVKVFASTDRERRDFYSRIENKRSNFRKVIWFNEWIFAAQGALIIASYVAVWFYSLHLLFNNSISLGVFLLIWIYWSQLLKELFFIGRFVGRIEFALSDAAEMTHIIHTAHEVTDSIDARTLKKVDGSITFESVHFAYDEEESLFTDLDLHIPKGQKVGLVGPSGGGKSSITKLLLRFSDIDSGKILLDGHDISTLKQDDFRKYIAYVPQEPLLFHRSLADNIGYSLNKPDMKKIRQAAQLARASDFIDKLPHGYDTLVGERGVKLSGGEKQRVAIARAILENAPILVLDEATSALDSESEKLIQEALQDLMENKTALVIAHRLSTIQKLDRILVMDEGKIVEDGTHSQLIKKKGLYADLWKHQSGGFIE